MPRPATMAARGGGDIRIGISGWRYAPWRGRFYPRGLPQREELAFASRRISTIEINGSFYSLQRPSSWQAWHDAVPDDFVFAVKGPRYVTHLLRLQDAGTGLANFFASGVLALGPKLGPVLWQCPPRLAWDRERFDAFFAQLPRDLRAAQRLAKRHDHRVEGRTWLGGRQSDQPLRHAVEIRHPSFVTPDFVALLRRHRIAMVVADTAGRWPLLEDLTADFVYVRLHGDRELYASGYGKPVLARWAARVDAWSHGRQVADAHTASPRAAPKRTQRDVFVYFDNDIKVHAPYDAAQLATLCGVPVAAD